MRHRILASIVAVVAMAAVAPTATPAFAAVEPNVHYTFDATLGDAKGASTLTAAPACPGDPCNATRGFGSDANGQFWHWSSTDPRGGGFTINTDNNVGTTYTISLKLAFSEVTSYRKIIDYQGRASDNGFYFYDGTLLFYPFDDESPPYPADTVLDLIAVRQATGPTSGTFTVYVIGPDATLTEIFSTEDPTGESIPETNGSGGTTLGFFFDDLATSDEATPSGRVYDLRIWNDRALTEADLREALLPAAPPPPEPMEPIIAAITFTG